MFSKMLSLWGCENIGILEENKSLTVRIFCFCISVIFDGCNGQGSCYRFGKQKDQYKCCCNEGEYCIMVAGWYDKLFDYFLFIYCRHSEKFCHLVNLLPHSPIFNDPEKVDF